MLIVVSHYAARSTAPLERLLAQLKKHPQRVLVVINDDACAEPRVTETTALREVLVRPNVGMNIGAWDAAYRHAPEHSSYLFLQDECELLDDGFAEAYDEALRQPRQGLAGESINPKWDRPWEAIAASGLNYAVGRTPAGEARRRLDVYRDCWSRWNIAAGSSGRHLRSLTWAVRGAVMAEIGGFPIGHDKEECIAAEIGTSKLVEQHGLRVTQVAPQPFRYIGHVEWLPDGSGKR